MGLSVDRLEDLFRGHIDVENVLGKIFCEKPQHIVEGIGTEWEARDNKAFVSIHEYQLAKWWRPHKTGGLVAPLPDKGRCDVFKANCSGLKPPATLDLITIDLHAETNRCERNANTKTHGDDAEEEDQGWVILAEMMQCDRTGCNRD